MRLGVLDDLVGFVKQVNGSIFAVERVLMRASYVQTWFQHHYGQAMDKHHCKTCASERLFTIWIDGRYHCLHCLCQQARDGQDGPIPLETTHAAMREFVQMWISYRRCQQAMPEDGWMLEAEARPTPARVTTSSAIPPAPTPICQAGECAACMSSRPHVLGAGGFKHCFYCLMKQGLKAVPAEVQKRPTMDRLNAAAAAAQAIVADQVQAAAV